MAKKLLFVLYRVIITFMEKNRISFEEFAQKNGYKRKCLGWYIKDTKTIMTATLYIKWMKATSQAINVL